MRSAATLTKRAERKERREKSERALVVAREDVNPPLNHVLPHSWWAVPGQQSTTQKHRVVFIQAAC